MDESFDPSVLTGWYSGSETSQDVVVSSRVRLSRNLADFYFPQKMNVGQKRNVFNRVSQRIYALSLRDDFYALQMEKTEEESKKILLEKNLITKEMEQNSGTGVFLSEDETLSILINDVDHLRLIGMQAGLCLTEVYKLVSVLDMELERDLEYAVSLELGYLSPEIFNTGTGMRASVMVHLPGLARNDLIEDAFAHLPETGFNVKGFRTKREGSLGEMYQISNKYTLGHSEEEILKKLDSCVAQLVHYEKAARDELLDSKQSMLEDAIGRALGTLKFSRLIEYKEAVSLLSSIRLGVSLGLVRNIGLSEITALFFLLQDNHILKQAKRTGSIRTDHSTILDAESKGKNEKKNKEEASKMSIINWERAMMLRKALRAAEV